MLDRKTTRTEIPFNQIKGAKMVLGTLGLMVFLITICLSASVLLERSLQTWRHEAMTGFTVTLPTISDPQQHLNHQLELMQFLRQIPGVLNLEVVTQSKRTSIFDPWNYSSLSSSSVPSSYSIEATLDDRVKIDFPHIASELEMYFPSTHFEKGRKSKSAFLEITHAVQIATMIVACLIGIAAIFTIVFTTHTGLVIHERVIEILRLIGAEDRFIAKQFQKHALNLSLKGGALGIILSAIFYFLLTMNLDLSLLPLTSKSFPSVEIWSIILFSPLLVALVVMASARTTVMFSLSQEK